MTIIDDFVNYFSEYEEKYGEKTCLFMQVGDFFEVYSVTPNCPKIKQVANILDTVLSRKNKSINEISRKNPYMLGFPIHYLNKYLTKLLDKGYTIPVIEQVTEAPDPKRELTKIFSPGTLINNIRTTESNNLVSIWIEDEKCLITNKNILCIGISIIDISIGCNYIYDFYNIDFEKTLTELYQIIDKFYPKELIINYNNYDEELLQNIVKRINVNDRIVHTNKVLPIYLKLSYQTELLERIFENKSLINIFEYLNLERIDYGRNSYILLLNFIYEHNPLIIEKINKPEILSNIDNLLLHNNTLLQLNIIENKNIQINTKYKSLFHVIDQTSTPLGKRLLKYRLLNPIFNIDELTNRYDNIDIMINSDQIDMIEELLNNIYDIERLHRRVALKSLQPFEFANSLDLSYESIKKLLVIINHLYGNQFITEDDCILFNKYRIEYNQYFNLNEMTKYNLKNIKTSFFHIGIYLDIDQIQADINNITEYFNSLASELSDMIEYNCNYIKVEHTERDGYFLSTTNKRADILKRKLSEIDKDKYEFKKKTATVTRIVSNDIKSNSHKLIALQVQISERVKEYYLDVLELFYNQYSDLFIKLANTISNIDVIKSCAKISYLYSYCRPNIIESQDSYLDVVDLRHPIIERLNNDIPYIANSIQLGLNTSGILLYGLNFSGKSSYLRAIGLCVILAQSGIYVPATSFVYNPYKTFFTRISGDDNLFQGQSSFTVEMNDLRTILEYSNSNSIILADELCKGTEYSSSLAIVASSIITLANKNANFIFTTHINELSKMERINNLKNIKHYHLHVECNNDGTFIYDRQLREGSGSELYGIEVARSIKINNEVIKLAMDIRNEYAKQSNIIINPKVSKYNSEIYIDKCKICNITYTEVEPSTLDVHHISLQKYANCYGIINNFHKNELHNLIVVCKPCHIKIHQYNDTGCGINIINKIQTSDGVQINWELIENTTHVRKKCKYSNEDLKTIYSMKHSSFTQKNIINKLNTDHNIKISISTLRRLYKNID
jgi:DNA mismatch repair protein MutS